MARLRLASAIVLSAVIFSSCHVSTEDHEPKGANVVNTRLINGKAASEHFLDPATLALAEAACRGDRQGITQAIANGASPNAYGVDDVSPLLWAMLCKSTQGMEGLLAAGADPNLVFHDCTLMCMAAGRDDTTALKLLLSYGGDPNARYGESHWTALRLAFAMAIDTDNWDNYYALLHAGADINLVHLGETIAFYAATLNRYEKVDELLDAGYQAGLDFLGKICQFEPNNAALKPDPQTVRERDKVLEKLRALGVKFPVPANTLPPPDTPKARPI